MSSRSYYGTTTAKLSEIARNGLDNKSLVESELHAKKQAEEASVLLGGKPIILKVLTEPKTTGHERIEAKKIFVCNY